MLNATELSLFVEVNATISASILGSHVLTIRVKQQVYLCPPLKRPLHNLHRPITIAAVKHLGRDSKLKYFYKSQAGNFLVLDNLRNLYFRQATVSK